MTRYVTVTEVARRLCISRVTALKRLKSGAVPGRRLAHGMARVDREVFEKWFLSEDLGKVGKVG